MKKNIFFKLALLLAIVACSIPSHQTSAQGVKVIIIDPGHGGKFPGAHYKSYSEKTVTLKVAQRLNEIIKKEHPEIKVILTRNSDTHLSTSLSADLGARSKIANEARGDIFISIHANAASNSAAKGVETIIMGESSLEKQRNDAALYTANRDQLVDMSDEKAAAIVRAYIQNLQFTYGQYSELLARLIQKNYGKYGRDLRPLRRQPLMVLYGTDMPCVLTEIGFMSNPAEFAYMTSTKGLNEIAMSIYGGIKEYIEIVNRTSGTTAPTPKSTTATTTPTRSKILPNDTSLKSGYTIQILSSKDKIATKDRQFKEYAGQQFFIKGNNRYKYRYCLGRYATKAEAQKDLDMVRRSFSGAYITTFKK